MAGTTHATLHFIKYEQRAGFRAALTDGFQECLGQVAGTCYALDWLHYHCGCLVSDGFLDRRNIAARQELHIKRSLREAIPFLHCTPGNRTRRSGASMKAAFNGHNFSRFGDLQCQLQRVFIGFGTGIDEEHRVQSQTTEFCQLRGRTYPHVQRHRVTLESQRLCLSGQSFNPAWMAITHGSNSMTTVKIKHLAAIRGMQIHAHRIDHFQRKLCIHMRQMIRLICFGGVQWHYILRTHKTSKSMINSSRVQASASQVLHQNPAGDSSIAPHRRLRLWSGYQWRTSRLLFCHPQRH